MSKEFLYRRLGSAVIIVILALFAVAVPQGAAQGRPQLKRPEEIPQEKPAETKKPKKGKGPRAVGLLQLSSSGKATLIPIAILIDGKFYDASVYKAEPVPMALESGTVYEVEREGNSQGLFTINGALHSKTAGSIHPWVGAGSYLPKGTEVAKTTRKAEDVPVGLDSSGDEPPRLTRGSASKPEAAASNPSSTSPSTSGTAAPSGAPAGAGASAPPAPSEPGSGSAAGTTVSTSAGSSSGEDTQKPVAASDKPVDQSVKEHAPTAPGGQTSPGNASPGQTAQSQTSQDKAGEGQEAGRYYRPTLRRGKPTQPAPQEDEGAPKTGKPESPANATVPNASPLELVPAISDGGGPDPRTYKFFWKTGEEEERRKQVLALAADDVRAYASALAKNRIPAKLPAAKAAAAHKATAKPVQPVFENVRFRGFDVWGNNQPVMILSAEAHIPTAPGAAPAPESYSVTIVAKTDIYGNLHMLYTGVTDKFHLDVTPQLELIDAVDADGDGRGELLFSETTDAGNGYIIYRATADKLWKMFDSLGGK